MKIAVAATADQKDELLRQGLAPGVTIEWIDKLSDLTETDAVIDLLFDTNEKERLNWLKNLQKKIIIVNYVDGPIQNEPPYIVRLNGWPGFLSRSIAEVYCNDEKIKKEAEKVFMAFNKKTEWTTDTPGFATARIISMIINEAYFALEEKVSTKAEIDIAMKTGTNYPYGPFEWCDRIGIKRIYGLLKKLETTNASYKPCDLLTKEATN